MIIYVEGILLNLFDRSGNSLQCFFLSIQYVGSYVAMAAQWYRIIHGRAGWIPANAKILLLMEEILHQLIYIYNLI